ncbi:diphthamide synthesis protein [Candidatus Woesearchaeota archaeon]|nr:diphthamide synthesis protein [Candidatus Woesearchaeota archaeon]
MKTFFIEARLSEAILLSEEHIRQLPEKIGLITNIQHIHKLGELREQLESSGKKVTVLKGFHSMYQGQMYGCDFPAVIDGSIDAVLFVGTGKFHPRGIFDSKKRLFIYDPVNRQFLEVDRKDAEREELKKKAGYIRFLHATEIGVIISTKPGQLHNRAAEALKRVYPDKNFYLLVCDTIDFTELQNFTFIDCFVNTACPRLMEDYDKFPKPMINAEELLRNLTPEQKEAKKHPYPLYSGVL